MGIFRAAPRTRRARIARPLTAAASETTRDNAAQQRRINQDWQARALAYYNTIGECWYPAQFFSRSLAKIRFFPAVLDERGDAQEIDSGPLIDLLDAVQDPGGGRTELTGAYGRLMWLIGDGYLTVTAPDGEEQWEFLSPLELKVLPDDEGYQRRKAPGIDPEDLTIAREDAAVGPGEARVWRLWRRHPTYSAWSDSPVRAVLEMYELLAMLTLAAAAQGKSRAANRGMVYVPEELDFRPVDAELNDEDPDQDFFLQEFTEGLMAAIRDPGSAGAMAPMVARGPALLATATGAVPMKDTIGHIPLGPEEKYAEADMWDRTIKRIAVGLDWPVELMTGVGSLNHWSGWLVDEQSFRQHIAPIAQKFCDDLASAYLRPAARAAGETNWQDVVIGYDPAAAIVHPDEGKSAQELHDRLVISDETLRDKGGYTDDDAPDEDELARRIAVKLKQMPEGMSDDGAASPNEQGTGNDVDEQEPEQNGNGVVASAAQMERILGAADLAVERARSLAGARLVSKARACEACRERIAKVPQSAVAAALGMQQVRELVGTNGGEMSLVAGAAEEFSATMRRWQIPADWLEEISARVEMHALRTLYDYEPPPLPAGFASVVARAIR